MSKLSRLFAIISIVRFIEVLTARLGQGDAQEVVVAEIDVEFDLAEVGAVLGGNFLSLFERVTNAAKESCA